MIPLLLVLVGLRKGLRQMFGEIRAHVWAWVLWSFVGFGLFYVPLCLAAAFSPAWLVAGTWQFTIIAGSLLVPLFYEVVETVNGFKRVRRKIPLRGLSLSLIILVGIVVMEWQEAGHVGLRDLLLGVIPVLVASFAYPLGNRKMMEICQGRVDAYQRVFGMTLATLPLWVILAVYGWVVIGPPGKAQVLQSLVVAMCSGVIATVLFFAATDLAKGNVHHLAKVEATQSAEVVFTLFGESLLVSGSLPSLWAFVGIVLVVVGMILHSLFGYRPAF